MSRTNSTDHMVKEGAGGINQKPLRLSRIQPLAESVQEVGDGCLQVVQTNPELAARVGFIEDHLRVKDEKKVEMDQKQN